MNRYNYLMWKLPAKVGSLWIERATGKMYKFKGYEEWGFKRICFEPAFEQTDPTYIFGDLSFPIELFSEVMKPA